MSWKSPADKKENGQHGKALQRYNASGILIDYTGSCVTAGTIHGRMGRCLAESYPRPLEMTPQQDSEHERYLRQHRMTSVCPYRGQNTQRNGITWHLLLIFRAKQATPLFILSTWSNTCTQVNTLFSPNFSAACRKSGVVELAGKVTRAEHREKGNVFLSRKKASCLPKT